MAGKKPPAKPESIDAEAKVLRQASEQTERVMQVLGQVTAPALKAISEGLDVSPALKAITEGLDASPALDALRGMVQKMAVPDEAISPLLGMSVANPDLFDFEWPVPTDSYILEAQRDTLKAIEHTRRESSAVWSKQIEVLEVLHKEAAEQTRLTRRVLAFAIAAVIVACIGIAVSVMIAVVA